jgi:hypothetical protein
MTTAGTNITKENIVSSFKTMRDTYNTDIVWHSSSNPFTPSAENTYNGNNNVRTNPASGTTDGFALGDLENSITDATITASTIVNQFREYASALSRIRRARLVKYYSTTFPANIRAGLSTSSDVTQVASLGSEYAVSMSDVSVANVAENQLISGTNIDQFVTNLSNAINTARNNTVLFQEFYCHSSCHSSCHGSI